MKNLVQMGLVVGAFALGACAKKGEGVSNGNCNGSVVSAYNDVLRACKGGGDCEGAKSSFLARYPDANCKAALLMSGEEIQISAANVAAM